MLINYLRFVHITTKLNCIVFRYVRSNDCLGNSHEMDQRRYSTLFYLFQSVKFYKFRMWFPKINAMDSNE